MTGLIIFTIIVAIIFIALLCWISEEKALVILISIILIFIGMCTGAEIQYRTSIEPIEVYRNNTELEITYTIVNNDTIACDSVVILKNKLYGKEKYSNRYRDN